MTGHVKPGPADVALARPSLGQRSPALPLIVGLVVAMVVMAAVGVYMMAEVGRLRDEQASISERNRKDALQLLRISNDLASLASLMRDMVDPSQPYPIEAWRGAFGRLRTDLREALAIERELAPTQREPVQQARLESSVTGYWTTVDRIFDLARAGKEREAALLVGSELTAQHRELSGLLSQLLVVNNRMQEEAAQANRAIFDRVRREILVLIAVLSLLMATAGGWVIAANRRAFEEVRQVSAQLRALSWRSLDVQEDVQRSISRELHDDFGQIVTAIGTLLGRARRHFPPETSLLADLDMVRGVAQETLDRIRTRSQWLHPGVLDDFGLEKALARCVEQYERQTGIRTRFAATGPVDTIRDDYAIHVYRIAQEALGNISRHSGSQEASVRLTCGPDCLELEIEDHGRGLPDAARGTLDRGMGLVSMRERAELMGGHLALGRTPHGGLVVQVRVPAWSAGSVGLKVVS
jgi:signal transduction histidine kinase